MIPIKLRGEQNMLRIGAGYRIACLLELGVIGTGFPGTVGRGRKLSDVSEMGVIGQLEKPQVRISDYTGCIFQW